MTNCALPDSRRRSVLQWLTEAVPEKRLQHICRVETMAVELAQHHGLDVESAQAAALMHDLAKCFPPQTLLTIAEAEGWTLDPAERQHPHLLHAPVGAVVARDRFGVSDISVLRAIANHTVGHPAMDAISAVVYLADKLEPGRGGTASLQRLRSLSYRDWEAAVYETCVISLQHLLESRRPLHPRTILTHNRFLQVCLQKKAVGSAA